MSVALPVDVGNIDARTLEAALMRASQGRMIARLDEIVRVARLNWDYPGSDGDAHITFLLSRRYTVEYSEGSLVVRPAAGVTSRG